MGQGAGPGCEWKLLKPKHKGEAALRPGAAPLVREPPTTRLCLGYPGLVSQPALASVYHHKAQGI